MVSVDWVSVLVKELVIESQMPDCTSPSSVSKSEVNWPGFFVTRTFNTCDRNELIMTRVLSGP